MEVVAEPLSEGNLDRATQLLNKTNQMNLSTRRLTREELWTWSREAGELDDRLPRLRQIWRLRIGGDCQLCVGRPASATEARIVDFILSCRVMGRKVEETMLHVLTTLAQSDGVQRLRATHISTPKNQPCRRFLENAGLLSAGGESPFTMDLKEVFPKPASIHLVLGRQLGEVDRRASCEAS